MVDEIENCFHKNLVNNILFLLTDKTINRKNAQLIFHNCFNLPTVNSHLEDVGRHIVFWLPKKPVSFIALLFVSCLRRPSFFAKDLNIFSKHIFFWYFLQVFCVWPQHAACGLLVPHPGIEPTTLVLEAQSLNHWTTREVLPLLQGRSSITLSLGYVPGDSPLQRS